eukprot:2228633-Pyramimonas_sp.AAC.1
MGGSSARNHLRHVGGPSKASIEVCRIGVARLRPIRTRSILGQLGRLNRTIGSRVPDCGQGHHLSSGSLTYNTESVVRKATRLFNRRRIGSASLRRHGMDQPTY